MFLVDIVSSVSLMLVGIPTNLAVIWIYTRKNSRLSQNKFPVVFAIIDLVALICCLPVFVIVGDSPDPVTYTGHMRALDIIKEFLFGWQISSYLTTLFMASIDKLFAITFPFQYQRHGKLCFKICVFLVFIINVCLSVFTSCIYAMLFYYFSTVMTVYSVCFVVIFVLIIGTYGFIIAKLKYNNRKLRQKIAPSSASAATSHNTGGGSVGDAADAIDHTDTRSRSNHVTTSANNRRHMLVVTQLVLILTVYVISFVAMALQMNVIVQDNMNVYIYFLNHISNFFVYVIVNSEFRKEARKLLGLVVEKVRGKRWQSIDTRRVTQTTEVQP